MDDPRFKPPPPAERGVTPVEKPAPSPSALGPSSAQGWLDHLGGAQDEAWLGDRPALGSDGRVEGTRPPVKPAPPRAMPPEPPPALEVVPLTASIVSGGTTGSSDDAPLELVERHRPAHDEAPVAFGDEVPRAPLRWGRWVMLLLLAAAVGAGVWFRGPLLSWARTITGAKSEPVVLLVNSDPPGAKVLLDRKEIGTTPLAIANQWSGTVHLVLWLPGYWPYEVTVQGGAPVHVDALLKKH